MQSQKHLKGHVVWRAEEKGQLPSVFERHPARSWVDTLSTTSTELECHGVACSFSAVSQTFSRLGFASLRKDKDSSKGRSSQGDIGQCVWGGGGDRNVANWLALKPILLSAPEQKYFSCGHSTNTAKSRQIMPTNLESASEGDFSWPQWNYNEFFILIKKKNHSKDHILWHFTCVTGFLGLKADIPVWLLKPGAETKHGASIQFYAEVSYLSESYQSATQ